jgi:hypothetical protein
MVKTLSYEELSIAIDISIMFLCDRLMNGAEMPYYLMN